MSIRKYTPSLFREFYVHNASSFKSTYRSERITLALLVLQSVYLFSLLLSASYLSVDISGQIFSVLSIHSISEPITQVILIAILSLNVLTVALILYLFIRFSIRPKRSKQNKWLSVIIMNYNLCVIVPSVVVSAKLISSNNSQVFLSLSIINLIWTFIVSTISSIHSTKFYSFLDSKQDTLAKFGSVWDYLKYPILTGLMVCLELTEYQEWYSYSILIFCGLNIIDQQMKNTYYSRRINQAYLAQNLNLFSIALVVELQLRFFYTSQITAIVIFLCTTIPLSWVVGGRLVRDQYERIDNAIQSFLTEQQQNNRSSSNAHTYAIFSMRDIEYYLDFFTRSLLEKAAFCTKKQKIMLSLFEQSVSFHRKRDNEDDQEHELLCKSEQISNQELIKQEEKESFGALIESKEGTAMKSLKFQVKQLVEFFSSRTKHSSKIESSAVSMQELFYLLEIEENLPKLAIHIQKFLHDERKVNRRSIREFALVKFLQDKLEQQENDIRSQEFISSSYSRINSEESTTLFRNDFSTSLEFQEDLLSLEQLILQACQIKLDFLNGISENMIDLDKVTQIGSNLMQLIKKIAVIIVRHSAQRGKIKQLQYLSRLFVQCLWIDPRDFKFKLIKNFNMHKHGAIKSDLELIMLQNLKINSLARKIDYDDLNHDDCVVLTSLKEKSFGKIIKVSDNCYELTGYSPNEMINQNCGVIQPIAIAMYHNQILRRGIEQGIQRQYTKENSPMILKHKDGYGIRVSLQLQINVMHTDGCFSEIGFAAKIKQDEPNEENYMMIDVSSGRSKVEVVSRSMFDRLLYMYFSSPKDVISKELGSMIPGITKLSEYMKKNQTDKLCFQSLIFLPRGSSEHFKRRLVDPSKNLLNNAKKHFYDSSRNDIFRANFSAISYSREDEYQVIILKIEEIKKVTGKQLEGVLRRLLVPHLVEFTGITREASTQISEHILNGKNYPDEQTTRNIDETIVDTFPPYAKSISTPFVQMNSIAAGDSNEDALTQDPGRLLQASFIGSDSMTLNSPILRSNQDSALLQQGKQPNKGIDQSLSSPVQNSRRILLHQISNTPSSQKGDRQQLLNHTDALYKQSSFKENALKSYLKTTSAQRRTSDQDSNTMDESGGSRIAIQAFQEQQQSQQQNDIKPRFESLAIIQEKAYIPFPSMSTNNHEERQISFHGSSTHYQQEHHNNQLRDALFQGINEQSRSSLQVNLILFISISFIFIITIVCIVYLNIRNQITTQELSFKYSWWQDKIQDSTISMLRLAQAFLLFHYTRVTQNTTELKAFKNSISATNAKLYLNCQSLFDQIYANDYSDLYLLELLYSTRMTYQRSKANMTYVNIDYSMLQVYQVYAYASYLYSQQVLSTRFLAEQDIIQNMDNISSSISKVTSLQIVSENELVSNMKSQVLLSLLIIISLSSVIASILLPFYWAFQRRKQDVLKLFASIEPESITKMYAATSNAIYDIRATNPSSLQIQNLNNDGTNNGNTQNLDIKKQIVKTKKHLPTTELPKLTLRFGMQVLFLLLVINVQPVVNQILISEQVSDSESDLVIVRGLYELSTSLVYAEYSMFAYTKKIAAPTTTYISESAFQQKVFTTLTQVQTSMLKFQNIVQQLPSKSRYTDSEMGTFMNSIFTVNVCNALKSAKPSYFYNNGGLVYNSTLCNTLFNGIFTKGYITAINQFQLITEEYRAIAVQNLKQTPKSALFVTYFNKYNPLMMENLFTLVKITQTAVINCISEEKEQYYAQIDLMQLILFVFEISFLVILFPSVVYPFFIRIKQKMIQVVEIIQILQIQHIQENSYICNFINQRLNF